MTIGRICGAGEVGPLRQDWPMEIAVLMRLLPSNRTVDNELDGRAGIERGAQMHSK